jgi:hypothetical protein
MLCEHERQQPDLKSQWRQLDELARLIRAREERPNVGDDFIALCGKYNRVLFAVLTRARGEMGERHA